MAIRDLDVLEHLFLDKSELRRVVAEQYAAMEIPDDPHATARQSRQKMLELGIRPHDNEFSQAIIETRDE